MKTNIIIFGGDGDLSLKKIFPALFKRIVDKQISELCRITVVSKSEYTTDTFSDVLELNLKKYVSDITTDQFLLIKQMVIYLQVDLLKNEEYKLIRNSFEETEFEQTLFYFSTPSSIFGKISEYLYKNEIITDTSKVILEKPLGHDLDSFEELNKNIRTYFKESQIYRIDHYLGKETVQNLMVLRFANHLFELAWNGQNIENIQITVAESIGVESRKEFYDKYGALKDMVQNHLLQLLCLVAMEPPSKINSDNVRNEKLKVLKALRPFNEKTVVKNTIKGQYTRGEINGLPVSSYQEDIERYDSPIETFVAIRTYVDNWRWAGVPFYLRTGKRMESRYSEIVINFKKVPHNLFPNGKKIENNKLIIRLQPEERIELVQMVKIPGPGGYRYKPTSLELDYGGSFDKEFPDAYERLLMDVIKGNQTLFMREDELRASWIWINSVTQNWEKSEMELELYKAGTQGPGDEVLLPGHTWHESN